MGFSNLFKRKVNQSAELKEQVRPNDAPAANVATDAQLFAKVKEFSRQLSEPFVNKEEEARLIALALITRENIIFVSEPGTAKSALAMRAGELTDSKFFKRQLSKFTAPEELFGPLDIPALTKESAYRMVTKGMLPEAELAFIDEIFRGGSAIRDTLLSIMNERKMFNGEKVVDVPIRSIISATNFVSYDEEDQAFYDRFLLRHFITPVEKKYWSELITATFNAEFAGSTKVTKTAISASDLTQLYDKIKEVDTSRIRDDLLKILIEVNERHHINFTDRRIGKTLKMIAASAMLDGRKSATVEDLAVLKYILPADEEESKTVTEKLNDLISPVNHLNRLGKLNENILLGTKALREDPSASQDIASDLETLASATSYARDLLKKHSNKELRKSARELLKNIAEQADILNLLNEQRKAKTAELVAVERNKVAS